MRANQEMGHRRISKWMRHFGLGLLVLGAGNIARAQQDVIPLTVELLNRSINKLPFVIAKDRGL